jgi:hypothetical protein
MGAGVPKIVSIRADVGDNWFLSFETTEATKIAMVCDTHEIGSVRKASFLNT